MQMAVIFAVEPAVLQAWWAWLIVALIVTLVDVALLVRVIRAANRIAVLTERALPSAKNIAASTAALSGLTITVKHASDILTVAGGIAKATGAIGETLGKLKAALGRA